VEPQPTRAIEVFYSYAHEDEKLRDELEKHLANLRRQRIIESWYDRDISGGKQWDDEIKNHLDRASVILLLISPDFMNSDYCNDVEVAHAMERHNAGEARVIPVILRPVDWKGASFSKLQALPTDVQPITSWDNLDEAFLDVTKGIRKAIEELSGPSASVPTIPDIPRPPKVGFVSRRDRDGRNVVERLREELAPQKNQLVALWGAGGVGKTTLAAEAVRELAETTGQRVIWTSADGRANFSFSTMLDDIAEQLGRTDLRPLAPQPKGEELRTLLADAPTLIVLDNFETIPPEEESLCTDFLAQRARCPALITTRERIDKASLIPLAAMSAEEASEFLERLIAQTQDPDIYAELDRDRLLRTAEFNPLIIQWIVAQIDLAQDPEEVLSDLAQGEGDAAQRVFDRSFNLPQMVDGGRAVLLALSLFMPSATRPAVAEVAGMNLSKDKDKKRFRKAQQTLASLWLIKQTDGGQRLVVEGLTRELSKSHLAHDPRAKTFHQRFVNRFLRYARTHNQVTSSDFNALEVEKDNLLGAMDAAFAIEDWSSVMKIADVLAGQPVGGMLNVRGYWDEAIKRNEQARDTARKINWEHGIAVYSHGAGIIRQNRGEYGAARIASEEALAIYRKLNKESNVAAALCQLGSLSQEQGEIEEARRLYNESLEISKKLGDQSGIAVNLHNLGSLAQEQEGMEEARRLYDESLEIEKKLGNQSGIASTLHQLAFLAKDQGDIEEARQLYDESLEINKKLGNQSGIASTLHQLGILAENENKKVEATRLFREALDIFERLKSPNAEIARRSLERVETEES
jgi:tetratricopeptide (TPR) repeat protein